MRDRLAKWIGIKMPSKAFDDPYLLTYERNDNMTDEEMNHIKADVDRMMGMIHVEDSPYWIRKFMRDCVNTNASEDVQGHDIYLAYKKWAEDHGMRPRSETSFGRAMRAAGHGSEHTRTGSIYRNMQVHSERIGDAINHPPHYTGDIECIDAMIQTQGVEAVKAFCVCNAFKYLWRHRDKNGDEDIEKAVWYLEKYLELSHVDQR